MLAAAVASDADMLGSFFRRTPRATQHNNQQSTMNDQSNEITSEELDRTKSSSIAGPFD